MSRKKKRPVSRKVNTIVKGNRRLKRNRVPSRLKPSDTRFTPGGQKLVISK